MPTESYVLYHFPFSLYSIMARYSLAVASEPTDADSVIEVEEKVVDIMHKAQLDEEFLCKINPHGLVPVLTSPSWDQPLPDSLDNTHYFGRKYRSLFPVVHEGDILRLLRELHDISAFSLAFGTKPEVARGFAQAVEERLSKPGISEEYRKALKKKLTQVSEQKVGGATPEQIVMNEQKASALLKQVDSLLQPGKPWLFGLGQATALDAHLVPFLVRLRDIGRQHMIPPALGEYVDRATATPEWQKVMEGRRTLPVH